MRMEKRKFRIGELAKKLDLERFVVRFWEKEFNIKTSRSQGKQRFYSEEDLSKFKQIKHLLYNKGFTIVGAKQHLLQEKIEKKSTAISQQHATHLVDASLLMQKEHQIEQLNSQIVLLKEKLLQLSRLLQP